MTHPAGTHDDRVRFAIAALGVSGLIALALAIRTSSPSTDLAPPDGPRAMAPRPASSAPRPLRPGTQDASIAPAAEWHGPRLAPSLHLPAGIATPVFTRQMPLPVVPPIEHHAPGTELVSSRRLRAADLAPVAFSRAVAERLPAPAADTASDRGVVTSAFASAGRHVGSSFRTVGRVLQRVF